MRHNRARAIRCGKTTLRDSAMSPSSLSTSAPCSERSRSVTGNFPSAHSSVAARNTFARGERRGSWAAEPSIRSAYHCCVMPRRLPIASVMDAVAASDCWPALARVCSSLNPHFSAAAANSSTRRSPHSGSRDLRSRSKRDRSARSECRPGAKGRRGSAVPPVVSTRAAAAEEAQRRCPGADMHHIDIQHAHRRARWATRAPRRRARAAVGRWASRRRRATTRSRRARPDGHPTAAIRAWESVRRIDGVLAGPARHLENEPALRQPLAQHFGDMFAIAQDRGG